jgi:hypothetical protein
MSRKWAKEEPTDRKDWPAGPWDSEPDFDEWTTSVGYQAYAGRLDSGAWYVAIIAPLCPEKGRGTQYFHHALRDKRWDQMDHQIGMVSYSDVEGYGEYIVSMEHYASPGPAYGGRTWIRGPYKTLEEVKQISEDVAKDIFDTLKDKEYIHYFDH